MRLTRGGADVEQITDAFGKRVIRRPHVLDGLRPALHDLGLSAEGVQDLLELLDVLFARQLVSWFKFRPNGYLP